MTVKICFLIAAHDKPDMLLKTFQTIYSDRHLYLIHIDRKSTSVEMAALTENLGLYPNVLFTPRHAISWGGFSQVSAELQSARLALSKGAWDYFVLLSGTDMMVRPLAQLEGLLASAGQRSFIDRREIVTLPPKLKERLRKRNRWTYLELRGKPWQLPFPLRLLGALPTHYGSQWHFLHRSYVEDVIDHIDAKGIPAVLRYCSIPDEVFWQNILNGRPDTEARIIADNHRYAVFRGRRHPQWITMADIPEIEASGAYFARKFDIDISGEAVSHYASMNSAASEPDDIA